MIEGMIEMYEPWCIIGQTAPLENGAVDNPPVSTPLGLVGAVGRLPFVVPRNKILVIDQYGLEAYGNVPGGLVLVPWLGDGPPRNEDCLMSVFADNATNQITNLNFHFAPGTKVNMRIMCNETPAQVVGWGASGYLREM